MIYVRSWRRIGILAAKGGAWLLYAAFLEYCVYKVMTYFYPEDNDSDDEDGNDESDNDAIFFTEKDNDCFSHICNKTPCGEDCSYLKMRKLLKYMEKAEHTLDVCIYHITSYDVTFGVLEAYQRGVKVRMITDGHRTCGTGSKVKYLTERGVPVRSWNGAREMHHKFYIVDEKTLVNCSFNWTMQAFTGNSEDAVICSEKPIVKTFTEHFNVLWDTLA